MDFAYKSWTVNYFTIIKPESKAGGFSLWHNQLTRITVFQRSGSRKNWPDSFANAQCIAIR